jgi:hypothetical protein
MLEEVVDNSTDQSMLSSQQSTFSTSSAATAFSLSISLFASIRIATKAWTTFWDYQRTLSHYFVGIIKRFLQDTSCSRNLQRSFNHKRTFSFTVLLRTLKHISRLINLLLLHGINQRISSLQHEIPLIIVFSANSLLSKHDFYSFKGSFPEPSWITRIGHAKFYLLIQKSCQNVPTWQSFVGLITACAQISTILEQSHWINLASHAVSNANYRLYVWCFWR